MLILGSASPQLVDFDRHNNTYTKLREKKEKSLSDEKNLFKVEQDFEAASAEYEHYNSLLQSELPRFFEYATAFISPLFHSFYYMQLNIFYVMLEKLNAFAEATGMNLKDAGDVEAIFLEKQAGAGDAVGVFCLRQTNRCAELTSKVCAGPRTIHHQARRDVHCSNHAASSGQPGGRRSRDRPTQQGGFNLLTHRNSGRITLHSTHFTTQQSQ